MAIYVRLTAGSAAAQTWSGSNLSVPFDGATHVIVQAYSSGPPGWTTALAPGITQWTLLNAPEGTAFNAAWFAANNGGGPPILANPLASGNAFILDKEGTWFFRCTRTDTSESIDFVVSTNNVRTNTRIPAAGETVESDQDTTNHAYTGGSPSGQGWAKDRNYALDVLDDLSTSGGVQLCYFNHATIPGATAPWNVAPAGLKAGAALAMTGLMHTINPTTGEQVPIVGLANGDTEPEYVGLFKTDTTGSDGTVTAVDTNRLIWVSRSGVVEAAPGVIDTTAYTTGEILFLGKNPGRIIRGSDRFQLAANKPIFSVPTCLVLNSNASGTVMTLPSEYLGGVSTASKSFRYSGIGDFSGLRVGATEVGTSIDNEAIGAIEMLAINDETGTISAGTVCMLTYSAAGVDSVHARIADANPASAVNPGAREGIVGIAIQNVLTGAQGHFVIYGPAGGTTLSVAATAAAATGAPLFVGSSRSTVATSVGQGVLFDEISGNFQDSFTTALDWTVPNNVIPVGQLLTAGGATVVMVGVHEQVGFSQDVQGGLQFQSLPSGAMIPASHLQLGAVGHSYNKSAIQIQDSAVTQSVQLDAAPTDLGAINPETTVVKVAGSGADDPIAEVSMYECKLPGTALWNVTAASATALAGTLSSGWPGSILYHTAHASYNTLYGTFNYDMRCGINTPTEISQTHGMFNTPTRVKVYGFTTGDNILPVGLKVSIRFNTLSQPAATAGVDIPTTNETPDYPYWTFMLNLPNISIDDNNPGAAADEKELCFDIPLYDNTTVTGVAGSGTGVSGNKLGSNAKPQLSFLSSGPILDATTPVSGNPVQNSFSNPIVSVDVALTRTDVNVATFVVSQVVLESDKHIQYPYRRSVFEACWPAHAFLNDTGALAISNVGATVNPAPAAGIQVPLVGMVNSGASLNTLIGFIPRDSRAQTPVTALATGYNLRVDGRFSGPSNVAADQLGLIFYIKEVELNDTLDKDITLAAPDVAGTTVGWVPVLTAATLEVANCTHMVQFPTPTNDNVIGWWFTVERSAIAPYTRDIDGAEVFYQMTNVQLQGMFNDDVRLANTYVSENVYEEHVLATALIDEDTSLFSGASYGDIGGFNFPTGGSDEAYFTTSFDYRYDDKSGVIVEVITAAKASGGSVQFRLDAHYSDCGDLFPAYSTDTNSVGTVVVDNTAAFTNPATNVRFLKHTFLVPPQRFWSDKNTPGKTFGSPNASSGANKGTVRWKLQRMDSQGYDVIFLSATVRSNQSNKSSLSTVLPGNINESLDSSSWPTANPVYLPTYPFMSPTANTNLSIQRFTWQFVSPAAMLTTRIAGPGEGALVPAGMGTYDLATPFSTTVFGQYIPYSFAITDIYGYCIHKDSGRTAADGLIGGEAGTAQIALDFRVMEVPQATGDATLNAGKDLNQDQIVGMGHDTGATGMADVIVYPGVQGFPLTIYPDASGNIRWTPSSMASGIGDNTGMLAAFSQQTQVMPKVLLPDQYKSQGHAYMGGHQWQLCCFARNVTAGDLFPLVHVSVEVALIPHYNDDRHGMMGGALSSGTKKTY